MKSDLWEGARRHSFELAASRKKENKVIFSKEYPNLGWWIENHGWIEIGEDDYSSSWLRILDIGGMCWKDENSKSLDEALESGDIWLSLEIRNRFGEKPPKEYVERKKRNKKNT